VDSLLKLEDQDYRRLQWISDRLGLTISHCLRCLIPKVEPPAPKTVTGESEIASADHGDLVPITQRLQDADRKQLSDILDELKSRKWGKVLATEIYRQVLEKKAETVFITAGTYKRLGKWITPHRWSEREQFVKPRAERISDILFGRRIERVE